MYTTLLSQLWKSFRRSSRFEVNVLMKVMYGFIFLYISLNLIALGYFGDLLIRAFAEELEPVETMTGLFFFYLLAMLAVRFLFQTTPSQLVLPYLHLPIKRSALIHFIMIRTLGSYFNFIPLLVLLPFALKSGPELLGPLQVLSWLICLFTLVLVNNFLAVYLKKLTKKSLPVLLPFALAYGLLVYVSFNGIFPVHEWFSAGVLKVATFPVLLLIPLALAALAYMPAYYLLKNNANYDALSGFKASRKRGGGFSVFDMLDNSPLISLDLSLIMRNKRPRVTAIMVLVGILYGFVVYGSSNPGLWGVYAYLFWGTFFTGMLSVSYGNYTFSWESSFFDFLLARNISMHAFMKSKYKLFAIFNALLFLLTAPYALFSIEILYINLALVLYNTGITNAVLLWHSTYNKGYIDLGKGAFFNYEGIRASNLVLGIPIFVMPILIFLPFNILNLNYYGLVTIAIIGLVGILLRHQIFEFIVSEFKSRRYDLADSYRKRN